VIAWCNRNNKKAIEDTIAGEAHSFSRAYVLTDDDFNPYYHYIYTAKKEEFRPSGPPDDIDYFTVPTKGWLKIALKVKNMKGKVWEHF